MAHQHDILILSDSAERCAAWRADLEARGHRVRVGVESLTSETPLQVVLADRPILRDAVASGHPQLAAGEVGVVSVGCPGPADVHLPSDCTPREVHLACSLLAQLVTVRSEKRRSERRARALKLLAATDALTGLPNRRAWDQRLSASSEHSVTVVLLDVDQFKAVNDRHGHAAGDEVLRTVGRLLRAQIRGSDFLARIGGDEFSLLLYDLPAEDALRVVDRIRQAVQRGLAGSSWGTLTLSAGVVLDCPADQAEAGLQRADAALRRAKSEGRNRIAQVAWAVSGETPVSSDRG